VALPVSLETTKALVTVSPTYAPTLGYLKISGNPNTLPHPYDQQIVLKLE
jgi:hypothetical protein